MQLCSHNIPFSSNTTHAHLFTPLGICYYNVSCSIYQYIESENIFLKEKILLSSYHRVFVPALWAGLGRTGKRGGCVHYDTTWPLNNKTRLWIPLWLISGTGDFKPLWFKIPILHLLNYNTLIGLQKQT